MMEGVAARLLCWQRGLTGWNEARQLVYSHTGERQEHGLSSSEAAKSISLRRGCLSTKSLPLISVPVLPEDQDVVNRVSVARGLLRVGCMCVLGRCPY